MFDSNIFIYFFSLSDSQLLGSFLFRCSSRYKSAENTGWGEIIFTMSATVGNSWFVLRHCAIALTTSSGGYSDKSLIKTLHTAGISSACFPYVRCTAWQAESWLIISFLCSAVYTQAWLDFASVNCRKGFCCCCCDSFSVILGRTSVSVFVIVFSFCCENALPSVLN